MRLIHTPTGTYAASPTRNPDVLSVAPAQYRPDPAYGETPRCILARKPHGWACGRLYRTGSRYVARYGSGSGPTHDPHAAPLCYPTMRAALIAVGL